MARKKIEDKPYMTPAEQEEVYEYFKDVDEQATMVAEEIDAVMRAEVAIYGNMKRYE